MGASLRGLSGSAGMGSVRVVGVRVSCGDGSRTSRGAVSGARWQSVFCVVGKGDSRRELALYFNTVL